MWSSYRRRFWVETALAATTAFLAVLTLISREWIELIFGVDPDHGSGSLEWLIVAGALVACVLFSALARAEWRRANAPAEA
jgi:hypothetical protein